MQLLATQSKFVEMFNIMNMSGLFNPVVVSVKKNIISMVGRDDADTVLTVQKYKNIKIEDGTDTEIVFDTEEMIGALKLFKPEEDISISILDNSIIIANSDTAEINDVLTIPQIDIDTIDTPKFPFKIVKGLPVITNKASNEKIEFSINATIPIKYLEKLVKRADFAGINPRIYNITIGDNKLCGLIGSPNNYQKSVKTTVDITCEGSGELLFGSGFEEMISTLSGNIRIDALPGAPAWVTYKTDNNIVYILVAPAMEIEE